MRITRYWDANDGAASQRHRKCGLWAYVTRSNETRYTSAGIQCSLGATPTSVLGEDRRGDNHPLDFGGALVDLGGAHVAEKAFDG